MTLAVTIRGVEDAAARLLPYIHRTPLLTSTLLCDAVGAEVRAKAEHLQRSGSFKIRGAMNRLLLLSDDERAAGVVAFSSGNHAQGVALAARLLRMRATIVMPVDAPAVKRDATRAYGAEIVEYDRYIENRDDVARTVLAQRGGTLVPPFDDPAIIAGQGTVGLEIAQDWPDVEVVVMPVGGGGLSAGMAIALKHHLPHVRLIGVEPEVADDARQSLAKGEIVRIPVPRTVADGVATTALGVHTFPVLRALLDEIVTVPESQILDATRFVLTRMKQVVEPTGALTTAALLHGLVPDIVRRKVVTVFCGGNLDLGVL